jgi:hypothetical protein
MGAKTYDVDLSHSGREEVSILLVAHMTGRC